MKKRLVTVLFIVIASLLLAFYLYKKYMPESEEKKIISRTVIPQVADTKEYLAENTSMMNEDGGMTSMIPLNNSESLISIVSMDFDNDGYEDQVNAIKNAASPYISLLIGFYNKETATYERSALIPTKIIQAKTFVYTGKDLIGEHKPVLVYQGFDENGDSVLQAFLLVKNGNRIVPQVIADFTADGTIFISNVDRPVSYERSVEDGVSCPIWVYKSDTNEVNGSADQLQIMYDWDSEERTYVEKRKYRVSGSKLASKELARIQDGTEKTFARHLDGLWYKVENEDNMIRYLFFDYDVKEIIFLYDDTEEVYNWNSSKLRKNGIFISTVNMITENLQRSVNISLMDIDSINVRIQDDVRMIIGENTLWDGEYRKKNMDSIQTVPEEKRTAGFFIEELEKNPVWEADSGVLISFKNGFYLLSENGITEEGRYASEDVSGTAFIQMKGVSENPHFQGSYAVSYATYEEEVTTGTGKKKKTSFVTRENKDSIILQSFNLTPEGSYIKESRPVILSKYVENVSE